MESEEQPAKNSLVKSQLLLATLLATLACPAGFNPPGGVWKDVHTGAGDPISRNSSLRRRHLVFTYCNVTACAMSFTMIALFLSHQDSSAKGRATLVLQRTMSVVMVLALLSLLGAYASEAFQDTVTATYTLFLVIVVLVYLFVQVMKASKTLNGELEPARKVLMLLATFVVSVTYLAGLNPPGVNDDEGRHDVRFKVFFVTNTTAFVGSLLIVLAVILDKDSIKASTIWSRRLHISSVAMLTGLVIAYAAGSSRATTIYVSAVVAAVLICVLVQLAIVWHFNGCWLGKKVSMWLQQIDDDNASGAQETEASAKAGSRVLMLAAFAATITYQAGIDPPGGLWEDDNDGHMAGDPILFTTSPRRYKAFYYFNSTSFVVSLVVIMLLRLSKTMHKQKAPEAAMILNMLCLVGAFVAGTCHDLKTSIYVMSPAVAVLIYIMFHVQLFSLDISDNNIIPREYDDIMQKRRKRSLQLLILAATVTYQAGLTPPGGFIPSNEDDGSSGHRAGDPVLLHNFPRRYWTFFCTNSVSFMLSTILIILLVHRYLYRAVIRTNAAPICLMASTLSLVGAFAAGSTHTVATTIYFMLLVAATVVMFAVFLVTFIFFPRKMFNPAFNESNADLEGNTIGTVDSSATRTPERERKNLHSKRKYLMLLGTLAASVTYQAGLKPPGGLWQGDEAGHATGDPIVMDHLRPQYLAFFYSNSTSFVASIVVIVLLLPERLQTKKWWLTVINITIGLDFLGLLISYAFGSSRSWKTSGYVCALVITALSYLTIYILLSNFIHKNRPSILQSQPNEGGSGGHPATAATL